MRALFAVLVFTLGLTGSTDAFFVTGHVGGGGAGPPPSTLPLVRTVNNPTGSTSPAVAFGDLGEPFVSGSNPASAPVEVPSGNILTATLGGTPVRIGGCEQKYDGPSTPGNGALRWAHIMFDASGAAIPAGGSKDLVFTSTPGSWSTTTTRTNADWIAANYTIVVSNISTTSTPGPGLDQGPYTATFDGGGTNTITIMCTSPLGLYVQVVAGMVNGASVTHTFLQAVGWIWVAQKADGSIGPIASKFTIENTQCLKSNAGNFLYAAELKQNGVTIRGGAGTEFSQIGHPCATIVTLVGPRGIWDWTANDPQFDYGFDYTKLAATYKSPPYVHGITYTSDNAFAGLATAPITAVNTSTGLFSTTTLRPLTSTGAGPYSPTTIQFSGSLGGVTGISLNKTYWIGGTSSGGITTGTSAFKLYADETDAWNATSAIALGGSYTSGLVAGSVIGPISLGPYKFSQSDPGDDPALSLTTEWGAGYIVGGTQAWRDRGRMAAYAMSTTPTSVINDATGRIPSFLSASQTPASFGGTTYLNFLISNIVVSGAGCTRCPTGFRGIWNWGGPEHDAGNAAPYLVWLMEADPFLRRLSQYHADYSIGENNPAFGRNFQQAAIGSNTSYNGVLYGNPEVQRQIGWQMRNIGEAAFMSPSGSDEETYFENEMQGTHSTTAWMQAYWAAHPAGYKAFVGAYRNDASYPLSSVGPPYGSNFMHAYTDLAWNFVALINPDLSDLKAVADSEANMTIAEYAGGAFNNCPYWADNFNPGTMLSNQGVAFPGAYISSANEIGVGEEYTFDFNGATGVITVNDSFGTGWTPPPGGDGGTIPFLPGDKYRPFQTNSNASGSTLPPSDATMGFDYCVVNVPSPTTIQVSTTCGGAAITSWASSPTGVGGIMLPTASRACPSGMWHGGSSSPNVYMVWQRAGICLAAERGVTGALAACAANQARYTGGTASFGHTAEWGYDSSP